MFALVIDGLVHEVFPDRPEFHPDMLLVEVGPEVSEGWSYDGSAFHPPETPTPVFDLGGYAADKRWRIETGGIVVAGALIATDDRSKTLITGARIKADKDPSHTLRFKAGAGFVTLAAPQIIVISDAVFDHVQACFGAEADVLAAIEAGTITTIAEVDAHPAWPA